MVSKYLEEIALNDSLALVIFFSVITEGRHFDGFHCARSKVDRVVSNGLKDSIESEVGSRWNDCREINGAIVGVGRESTD